MPQPITAKSKPQIVRHQASERELAAGHRASQPDPTLNAPAIDDALVHVASLRQD